MRVDFYLIADPATGEEGLARTACRIVAKAFAQHQRIYVQAASPDMAGVLDRLLWTFSPGSFIPHIVAGPGTLDYSEWPVVIGTDVMPPDARHVAIAITAVPLPDEVAGRAIHVVGASETERASAREAWRAYRDRGTELHSHDV